MAKVISTYTNDAGHEIAVYESGAEYDTVAKRLTKPAAVTVITPERATSLIRARQEKQSALLRAAIRREHNAKMSPVANGSAAAFAESGALLYSEIVLNADAYPRDRMEAWEKLGKHAQVLDDPRRQPETVNNTMNVIALPDDVARAIADLRRLMQENRKDVIDE